MGSNTMQIGHQELKRDPSNGFNQVSTLSLIGRTELQMYAALLRQMSWDRLEIPKCGTRSRKLGNATHVRSNGKMNARDDRYRSVKKISSAKDIDNTFEACVSRCGYVWPFFIRFQYSARWILIWPWYRMIDESKV